MHRAHRWHGGLLSARRQSHYRASRRLDAPAKYYLLLGDDDDDEKREREGGRGIEKEREREGKRNDKNRGKEGGREGSGGGKKKKGSLPLDCNGREARFIALSRRCRCTHGDPSCAIPPYWLSGRWTLRGGHSRYTILYEREGERERGGGEGTEIGGLQDNLCVANY